MQTTGSHTKLFVANQDLLWDYCKILNRSCTICLDPWLIFMTWHLYATRLQFEIYGITFQGIVSDLMHFLETMVPALSLYNLIQLFQYLKLLKILRNCVDFMTIVFYNSSVSVTWLISWWSAECKIVYDEEIKRLVFLLCYVFFVISQVMWWQWQLFFHLISHYISHFQLIVHYAQLENCFKENRLFLGKVT